MLQPVKEEPECRVQVWFGDCVICSHSAPTRRVAQRYADLMAIRFRGLAVTIDDRPNETDTGLPHPLLWEQTVQ